MTLLQSFELSIAYASIHIINIDDPNAGTLDCEPRHLSQGFAWNPSEVDFYVDFTLKGLEALQGLFEVHLADQIEVASDSTRAILVPFTVGKRGVYVSDPIGNYVEVIIPPGHYALLFEIKPRDDPEYLNRDEYHSYTDTRFIQIWCRLTFVPQETVEPTILRVDEYLSPIYPLLMEAKMV